MKQRPLSFILITLIFAAFPVFGADQKSGQTAVLSPDKLESGMNVFGFSTLGPDGQTRFTGKILGILKDSIGPGHSWIIMSIGGENFRETGIIEGQSGSPVFTKLHGKEYFIGTVSYADEYAKNAIAYLTPANEVRASADYDVQESTPINTPPAIKNSVMEFLESNGQVAMKNLFERDSVSASTMTVLDSKNVSATARVKRGDLLSIELAYGDFHFGGFGTVSLIEGNKIFLLGHPMFKLGPVEYCLAPAKVMGVQANVKSSYIIAAPIEGAKPVGVITQDRETGIMGYIGREPKSFIPFNIRLVNSAGAARTYHFFSTSDRTIGPYVGAIGILQIVRAWSRDFGPKTIFLKGKVVTDAMTIAVNDEFHGDSGLDKKVAANILKKLEAVLDNDYQRMNIKEFDLEIDVFDEIRILKIEKVMADSTSVSPGGRANIKILLSQSEKGAKTLSLDVDIPKGLNFGTAKVFVGSAETIDGLENDNTEVVNLNTLIEKMNQKRSPDKLYVYVVYPPSKPDTSLVSDIAPGIRKIPKRLSSQAEEFEIDPNLAGLFSGIRGDFVIEGSESLELKISNKPSCDSEHLSIF